jgi:HEAT repeat protein
MIRERKAEGMTSQFRLESSSGKIEERLNADFQGRLRVTEGRRLVAGLSDPNSRRRAEVREKLLALGNAAVPALLAALTDSNGNARWQAAKALSQIHNLETANDLMNAMEDDDFGVRWLAAEGLIAMGPDSLGAVLQGLISCFGSIRKREGARHVLHALADGGFHDETIEKLLRTLQGLAPEEDVAWAAEQAWEKLIVGNPVCRRDDRERLEGQG